MKKGQIKTQNCAIKTQNITQVFFSENLQVFYVKTKRDHLPNSNFKLLITCEMVLLKEFLKFLESFKTVNGLTSYKFLELKAKLNEFLIKRAGNCKTITNKVA
ncbi:hypothetical protein [Tenacibaculum soleae]|uniref:hypothetical protein n=1 Tax=Tenacibaculum soleae TaxID=447689 RepID=UPI0023013549|nr:hypothetical protein [Tenacibaculum soleae]